MLLLVAQWDHKGHNFTEPVAWSMARTSLPSISTTCHSHSRCDALARIHHNAGGLPTGQS